VNADNSAEHGVIRRRLRFPPIADQAPVNNATVPRFLTGRRLAARLGYDLLPSSGSRTGAVGVLAPRLFERRAKRSTNCDV
jgi:hypothetical protein